MKKQTGFTLIELLVVVLIIGILAAVALPKYQVAVMKSRMTHVQSNIATLARAAEVYYLANGVYPPDDMSLLDVSDLVGCTTGGPGYIRCGNYHYDLNSGVTSWHDVNKREFIFGCFSETTSCPFQYEQYFQHSPTYAGERLCRVNDGKALSHQVCKAMGGVPISATVYRLP